MRDLKFLLASLICIAVALPIALAGSQGSLMLTGNLPLFAACGAIGFLLHWLVFIPSYRNQTEHYFDLTGSASFILTIVFALALNPQPDPRSLLLGMLIIAWALRLGWFLFRRVKRAGGDGRFDDIKTRLWRFAFTWTLGGLWVFLTLAAPLAAITSANKVPLGVLAWAGLAIWLAGFVIEAVADGQKTAFRAREENRHRFISHGLWAWSRHPNYFGEILLWFGLALIALPVLQGWQLVTLISPFFVTLLLTRVSGIPMLENRADDKWGDDADYRDYKSRTPVLIPRPPARSAA